MDRKIVYPGQVPLETDLLGTNLYAMLGLGHLAQAILGTNTVAAGLACAPTIPASMSVKIGAGSLYSVQNVDNSAYSSLNANTTDQVLKQGILLASENKTLALTAPTTSGYSVIYLVQAAFSETDTDSVVLPYYNSSDPATPYSGPSGLGSSQATRRKGGINITAKAGIAAPSLTVPSPDAGFVGLYTVTVAYGATTVTSSNIAVASGAPFITPGPYLPPDSLFSTYFPSGSNSNGHWRKSPDGSGGFMIEQWGEIIATEVEGSYTITFPIAFNTACENLQLTVINSDASIFKNIHPEIVSKGLGSAVYHLQWIGGGGDINQIDGVEWRAIGR